MKFSKTDIALSLGTSIEELNEDLTKELKDTIKWRDGKKQSFSPAKAKMIATHWGSYKEIKSYLLSCI